MIVKKRVIKRTSKKHESKGRMTISIYDGHAWVYEGYYLFGFIPIYVVKEYHHNFPMLAK